MNDTAAIARESASRMSGVQDGVLAPVLTPFLQDGRADGGRLVEHCRWLRACGAGLALFGTNSEANSLSVEERVDLLDQVLAAGIDPAHMMPGTGTCSIPETVRLTRNAVSKGCAGVLMLPPFYYKAVSDDGLFAYFARVIESVGDAGLRVYLYHIPPVAQVGISTALIERLLEAYPAQIAGAKDSSGDWANTRTWIDRFGPRGFGVYAGSETFLLATVKQGGCGVISAMANVHPAALVRLHAGAHSDGAEALQGRLDAGRKLLMKHPLIASMKALLSQWRRDPAWAEVRPPLVSLPDEVGRQLATDWAAAGFDVPDDGNRTATSGTSTSPKGTT